MKEPKSREEYLEIRKEGVYKKYIWFWQKDFKGFLPPNALSARPVRVFGKCLLLECDVVREGYEPIFFTNN